MLNVSVAYQPDDALASITAIANVVIAAAALGIAGISIYFTRAALLAQVRHNKLSVRPIPLIHASDFEDKIAVEIRNNGIGPLFIKDIEIIADGDSDNKDLIDLMPICPKIPWSDFNTNLIGTTILPGTTLKLIELSYSDEFDEIDYILHRDNCRRTLAPLFVRLDYTDVYGEKFDEQLCSLTWFSRHEVKK